MSYPFVRRGTDHDEIRPTSDEHFPARRLRELERERERWLTLATSVWVADAKTMRTRTRSETVRLVRDKVGGMVDASVQLRGRGGEGG